MSPTAPRCQDRIPSGCGEPLLLDILAGLVSSGSLHVDPASLQDLKDYMRQAGEVMYTNTHQNRNGEGVVEFGSRGDMEYALDKLDGSELAGRRWGICHEQCFKAAW